MFSLQSKDQVLGLSPLLGIKCKEREVQYVDEGSSLFFAFGHKGEYTVVPVHKMTREHQVLGP